MKRMAKNRKSNTRIAHRKETTTRRKCGILTTLAGLVVVIVIFLLQLNRSVLHTLREQNIAAVSMGPQGNIENSPLFAKENARKIDAAMRIRQSNEQLHATTRLQEPTKLQRQEQGDDKNVEDTDNNRYHLVFSTSCSKMDWQAYLFFYLALAHKQQGDVTHIVSGCKDQETEEELRKLHEEQHTEAMNENFHIHFTPDFSDKTQFQLTKYWNKPFGLKHWLEHRFGYRYDLDKGDVAEPTEYDDDIVILIDPDMLMLKPFRNDFSKSPKNLWSKFFLENDPDSMYYEVKQGQVLSQEYAFGGSWIRAMREEGKNLTRVLGTTDSAVYNLTDALAGKLFAGGPPYIATARDFFKISHHWTDFLPRYFHEKPGMMNEMYSYSMAVAHLGLKHQLAKGFMVSDTNILHAEGWDFLREPFPNEKELILNACNMSRYSTASLPQVLHFCQRYGIGEFFISKYKVPRRTFSCSFPLYEEPPIDVAKALYTHMGNFDKTPWDEFDRKHTVKRAANAFMVCSLYSALNEAATFYKDHHCDTETANYNKTWQYFKVYDRDPHGPGGGGSRSKPKPNKQQ